MEKSLFLISFVWLGSAPPHSRRPLFWSDPVSRWSPSPFTVADLASVCDLLLCVFFCYDVDLIIYCNLYLSVVSSPC